MEKESASFVLALLNGDTWWQVGTTILIVIAIVAAALAWITSSINKLLDNVAKRLDNLQKQEKSPTDYSIQVFKNPNIRYILRTIRHDLQADRVTVYQYHNGEESIASNPFMKVSCTHEVLGKDILSIIDSMKDKHIDIFDGSTTKIFQGEVYRRKMVSDMYKDGDSRTLAQTLSRIGTTSIYMFPLKTPLGRIFGFVAVEYCCEPTELGPEWEEWVGEKVAQVGALLAVEDLIKANKREELRLAEKGKSDA